MRKPQLFRDAIAKAFPAFDSGSRDKLAVYVENGRVRARPVANGDVAKVASLEFAYRLEAILLDFAGDANLVMMTALDWVAVHQPELLQRPDGAAIELQVDVLDDERADIQLSLELSEAVRRTGPTSFQYFDEPDLPTTFPDVDEPTGLGAFLARGEHLLP